MRTWISLIVLALGGCDTEVLTGTCVESAGETELSDVVLLYEGTLNGLPEDGVGWAEVITEEARLAELLGEENVSIEAVDFTTRQVIAASVYVSSTCGLQAEDWSVTGDESTVQLTLEVTDLSGACDGQCDATGHYGVLVSAPAALEATACAVRTDTCE